MRLNRFLYTSVWGSVFSTKLNSLRSALVLWNKETFEDIFSKLQELEDRVQVLEEVLQQNPGDKAT